MLSKIEVSTFQKINIFCHFEVHLGSKISENGYIANIGHLHLNCLNFSKLSCFMVFSHTSIRKQVTRLRKIQKQINKKCQDVVNGDWFSLRYLGSILGYLVIIYHKRILGMLCIPQYISAIWCTTASSHFGYIMDTIVSLSTIIIN